MSGSWVLFLLIFTSSIPVLAVYIWFRLAKYQFPLIRFLFALLAGAAAFFPALMLQNLLDFPISSGGRLALFFYVFVRVAFTEELSRLLMLIILFRTNSRIISEDNTGSEVPDRTLSFNDVKRGTAAGLVAGLGFAVLESAVIGASNAGILMLRAVTAAPLHAACGSRVGAAAVMFRTNPLQAIFRLLAATAIHGIYNFMVARPGIPSIAAVLIALSALASSIMTIRGMDSEKAFTTTLDKR
ncbi:MAG: PrsW family intramembrane metalloprotease [Treponema sp.]|jgi:RsiW-degrading membrane proteinase PrsW (M82 family)|nr:PrsW family intramembrane metalloprotease [Treponema sp.]